MDDTITRYKGRLLFEHVMYIVVTAHLSLVFLCFLILLSSIGLIWSSMGTGDLPWLIAGWFLLILCVIGIILNIIASIILRKFKIYENGIVYPLPLYKNVQYRRKYKEPGIFYYYGELEEIRKHKKLYIKIKVTDGVCMPGYVKNKTRDQVYEILMNTQKRYLERKEKVEPGNS